jgi:hypothetical protein
MPVTLDCLIKSIRYKLQKCQLNTRDIRIAKEKAQLTEQLAGLWKNLLLVI